jgi:hypothetical protein
MARSPISVTWAAIATVTIAAYRIAVTPAFDLSRRLDNGLQEVLHVAHEALLGLGLIIQLITAQ